MKNTYKILCALVLLSSAVACSVKDNYEPGTLPDNAQVYFSLDEGTDISLSDGQRTFNVNVFRNVTAGALSVPVSGVDKDESGIFTFPQSVSFADGSNKATVQVGVDFDNIISDIDYEISLKIGESEVTPYGVDAISLIVKFSPWTEWAPYKVSPATGVGDYYYDCIGEDFGADMDPALEVEYSQSLANPDNYKFRILHWACNKTLYFSYNAASNSCTIEDGDTGLANDYGEMFVTEFRDYVDIFEAYLSPEEAELCKEGSFYDPETGTFNLCVLYYIADYGVVDGAWSFGFERFCLDGFKQPDYSVSLKLNGLYVDMPEDDTPYPYANLDVMLGKEGEGSEDIEKVCLVMVPADLSSPETTLEALMLAEQMIVDGEEGVVTLRESVQNYLLPFPEPEITQFVILAASFDESGEIQDEAYITKNLEEEPEPERSAVRSRKVSAHTLKANFK